MLLLSRLPTNLSRFLLGTVLLMSASAQEAAAPRFNAKGELALPANYREWVWLSSGLGMTYGPAAEANRDRAPMFDNVFASPAAYRVVSGDRQMAGAYHAPAGDPRLDQQGIHQQRRPLSERPDRYRGRGEGLGPVPRQRLGLFRVRQIRYRPDDSAQARIVIRAIQRRARWTTPSSSSIPRCFRSPRQKAR